MFSTGVQYINNSGSNTSWIMTLLQNKDAKLPSVVSSAIILFQLIKKSLHISSLHLTYELNAWHTQAFRRKLHSKTRVTQLHLVFIIVARISSAWRSLTAEPKEVSCFHWTGGKWLFSAALIVISLQFSLLLNLTQYKLIWCTHATFEYISYGRTLKELLLHLVLLNPLHQLMSVSSLLVPCCHHTPSPPDVTNILLPHLTSSPSMHHWQYPPSLFGTVSKDRFRVGCHTLCVHTSVLSL